MVFEFIWRLLTRVSSLTEKETDVAVSVLGLNTIQYGKVRIAESGILKIIFKFNRRRAFTTFHTINMPSSGYSSRVDLDIVLHELVHVYQFECVGSIYIWEALRAQRTTGYTYGGWEQLCDDWRRGAHFRNFNREQQAQIAQDYYNKVITKGLTDSDPVCMAYEPFIREMKNGEL